MDDQNRGLVNAGATLCGYETAPDGTGSPGSFAAVQCNAQGGTFAGLEGPLLLTVANLREIKREPWRSVRATVERLCAGSESDLRTIGARIGDGKTATERLCSWAKTVVRGENLLDPDNRCELLAAAIQQFVETRREVRDIPPQQATTEAKTGGQNKATELADADPPNTMIWRAYSMYSINGCEPILITEYQNTIVQSFAINPRMATAKLKHMAKGADPVAAMHALAEDYDGVFAPAIQFSGKERKGYAIAVKLPTPTSDRTQS